MQEIKKVYFKYRTEAIESKMEAKLYRDLLKTLLSYINFGEKTKISISGLNKETFETFKMLKNELNINTITSNEELFLRNKSREGLIELRNKIDNKLRKKNND